MNSAFDGHIDDMFRAQKNIEMCYLILFYVVKFILSGVITGWLFLFYLVYNGSIIMFFVLLSLVSHYVRIVIEFERDEKKKWNEKYRVEKRVDENLELFWERTFARCLPNPSSSYFENLLVSITCDVKFALLLFMFKTRCVLSFEFRYMYGYTFSTASMDFLLALVALPGTFLVNLITARVLLNFATIPMDLVWIMFGTSDMAFYSRIFRFLICTCMLTGFALILTSSWCKFFIHKLVLKCEKWRKEKLTGLPDAPRSEVKLWNIFYFLVADVLHKILKILNSIVLFLDHSKEVDPEDYVSMSSFSRWIVGVVYKEEALNQLLRIRLKEIQETIERDRDQMSDVRRRKLEKSIKEMNDILKDGKGE